MWTVIFSVLIALSFAASLAAIYLGVRNAEVVSALRLAFRDLKPLRTESLLARIEEVEATVALVANRVKMTKVRNAVTHLERDKAGEPDAKSDPEAWRAWKNAQLRAGHFN